MPVFGPNISQMKQSRDENGLIQLLVHKDAQIRVEVEKALVELRSIALLAKLVAYSDKRRFRVAAAQVLKSIGDQEALDALRDALSISLRYGGWIDQIEAMMIIQGRAPTPDVWFPPEDRPTMLNVRGRLDLPRFQDGLTNIVEQLQYWASVWFALLTLVELGDRSEETLKILVEYSQSCPKDVEIEQRQLDSDIEAQAAAKLVVYFALESLKEQTLRSLSFFKGSQTAAYYLVQASKGRFLYGSDEPSGCGRALAALSALGDPSTCEYLQYLAYRGDTDIRRLAGLAVANFGKIGYEEMRAKMEKTA